MARDHKNEPKEMVNALAVEYFKNHGMAFDRAQARIADIDLAIVSVDPAMKVQIQGATQNFLIHRTPPHITIEARWDDLSEMELRGQKLFESGAVWQLYQDDSVYIFSLSSQALGSIPYKVARVQKDFSWGEVLLHRGYFDQDRPIYPLEYPLDELLFIHYLASGRGAEVHACGVVDSHGNGHLFLGQSGAGKTTLARQWQNEEETTILSDDRIILRQKGGELWMHGTPWHGEAKIASPFQARLSRIYFLEHGKKNELVELGTTEAMARLFACSFVPFYSPEALKFTAGFFEEVAKAVPCSKLSFFPDKRVVGFIQQLRD
jgi:hypothetical protein